MKRQNGLRDVESRLEIDADAVIPLLFGKFGREVARVVSLGLPI